MQQQPSRPFLPYFTARQPVPPAGPETDAVRRLYLWLFWGTFISNPLLAILRGIVGQWLYYVALAVLVSLLWGQWKIMRTLGNNRLSSLLYMALLFIPIVPWFVLASTGTACHKAWGKIGAWRNPPAPAAAAPAEEPVENER
jgi:hypothetical protein